MKDPAPQPEPEPAHPTPFDAFKALASKIATVSKAELDKREAKYQREQAKKPRRGPKPKSDAA